MSQASGSVQSRGSSDSDKRSPKDRRTDVSSLRSFCYAPGYKQRRWQLIQDIPLLQPQQQASAIEKSVTHLLVATKSLLETLTQWSRGAQTENDVSDVYVRLGYEFNIACRAFSQVNIDTSDLGNVPDTLRTILEETLSQEASQASLDRYLPKIRDIIINLLHGLKRKQQKLRSKTGRDGSGGNNGGQDRRQASLASTLTIGDESQLPRDTQQHPRREGSRELQDGRSSLHHSNGSGNTMTVQTSDSPVTSEPRRSGSAGKNAQQYPPRSDPPNQQPPLPPYPHESAISGPPSLPPPTQALPEPPREAAPPPRPPPKQQDALAALQRGGELERRASRRFSQYQISKQLGTSPAGVPMIPPAQRSPIPNRGRDIRESLNAVKSRGSQVQRSRSRHGSSRSPERKAEPVTNIRQSLRDNALDSNAPNFAPPVEANDSGSPDAKTPEDKYQRPHISRSESSNGPGMRATITKPWDDAYPIPEVVEPRGDSHQPKEIRVDSEPEKPSTSPKDASKDAAAARQSLAVEPLTLFLQYKSNIKKLVLSGGFEELTMARLQLAFIEKFSWHTHNSNADLPEIYVQDQVSGVRHELEDLNDVKNHSVLVLNVDNVDEVKRHFDDGLAGMKTMLETIKSTVSEQAESIQRISNKQHDAARDIKRFSTTSRPPTIQPTANGILKTPKASQTQLDEVHSLRRELAVLRQTHTEHIRTMETAMDEVKKKATVVKDSASKASGSSDTGRGYVNAGKKQLSDDSEKIINRVDDLQDTVEDLRKDVTRGVRPLPRQLESVNKEITTATADLKKLRDWLQHEKPKWKKISEDELKQIMDDQEVLNVQEELFTDLEDDLEKASQTFTLVEQASKQQNVQNGSTVSTRSTSRTLNPVPDVDPMKAKDTVMGEVRALQPNHEGRLEAIERAERARRIELDNRAQNAFKKELGNFVEENKLKKTGGVEETERLRLRRDEEARKENFQRMAERRARQEAEVAAAAVASVVPNDGPLITDNTPQLNVPEVDDGGTTSPEPEFVEAQESPLATGTVAT